jgi:hypothetical protein
MTVRRDLKATDWIEVNYKGRKYLVSLSRLLDLFNKEKEK